MTFTQEKLCKNALLLALMTCITVTYGKCTITDPTATPSTEDSVEKEDPKKDVKKYIIKSIAIEGNKYVKAAAILHRLPYKIGDSLEQTKNSLAIHNLYALGSFRQIRLEEEKIDDTFIRLFVVVEEKKLLEKINFKGNRTFKAKQIKEKLNLDKISTIDEETLHRVASGIQKMYRDENKHLVKVNYTLVPDATNPDKATAEFTINEGPKSLVKRVYFVGNDHIPTRRISHALFTRENWLLSFMDSAGTYQEEMLDMDKHRIEYFYRDHGYLMAKVAKAKVDYSKNKHDISVTFIIKEGAQFIIRSLDVVGDEVFNAEQLRPLITLEKGSPFSQTKLVQTMNKIKDLYGEEGYIYADVYPQVKPDENTNKVDVTFHVERGKKMYAHRIIITGNRVTRDKVIRRQLELVEGDLITTQKLNLSQSAVEYLSYFDREGVKWKMHRLSDELADLEMNVKEAKTGNLNFMLTYGTDQNTNLPSLRGSINVEKGNLFGLGMDAGGMIQADRHHLRKLELHFMDPHIFDSNVSAGISLYKRWDEYEQWKTTNTTPTQRVLGGDARFGFWLPKIDKRLQLITDLGIEDIKTNHPYVQNPKYALFAPVVKRTFQDGTLKWLGLELTKDIRDHQVYPKTGYKVTLGARLAPTGINNQFSFFKVEAEASCYNSLIGEDSLVLVLHAKMGNIRELAQNRPVPYKELYHMGGQSTVRGFTWGGIGPAWINGDPLGARNALQFNTELVFPLIPDYSMKGHVFYDAGAGWDTPKDDIPQFIPSPRGPINPLRRDNFDLRHSIGIGLNLLKPVPAKIDWGFKLDRKKQEHESASEFHLSMNYAW